MNNVIYSNGIDLDTGTYAVPPLTPEELGAVIRGEKPAENIAELTARANRPRSLGTKEGVDPKDLSQTGWSVILAANAPPEIEKALQPLLKLREDQAGKRFHRYAYEAGDSKDRFLSRHGAGPGPADPDKVPYYLLIVGDPATIPYSFQSQLDVQYAVGRIHFETLADYATYAESVVAAETGRLSLARQATFFGVTHQNPDTATEQSLTYLVDPLLKSLQTNGQWQIEDVRGLQATKQELRQRLGGSQTPALLLTASHGLNVPQVNQRNLSRTDYQGALICADWPGIGNPFDQKAHFFAGEDLGKDANLLGLIALFFACFSTGTPREDVYNRLQRIQIGQQPGPAVQLAPQPFIAGLPRRMLSAPGGGALAVIGHVERSWPSSFLWKAQPDGSLPPQTAAFESTLKRLMEGYPVGAAVEYLNQKYAELATMLKDYLEAIEFGDAYDRVEFANVWMASTDAQWYTIVGDPAVRLPVVENKEVKPRPILVAATAATSIPVVAPTQADTSTSSSTAAPPNTSPPQPSKEETMSTPAAADPRFAQPFTPIIDPSPSLNTLKAEHPELYKAYVDHVKEGYENNGRIFDDVLRAFMRSHNSTVAMYWILFAVGVGAVVAGIVLAVWRQEVAAGAVFLGLGAIAFITYFISRPTQSVEENLMYVTWLGVIYNSYWTHLAWATRQDTAQTDLDKATLDALQQLAELVDRHAKSTKGRPAFG